MSLPVVQYPLAPELVEAMPLTPCPPGRQLHLPGVVRSDDGLRRWLDLKGQQHLDSMCHRSLDCVDVSHNNLTDAGCDAVINFLIDRRYPTRRLKLFNNNLQEPESLCRFVQDPCCGVAASEGLAELHLSHNSITRRYAHSLLTSIGQAVQASGGRLRQTLWLRLERNSDLAQFQVDPELCGAKLCLEAGTAKSGCNLRFCKHRADVHLVLSISRGPPPRGR